MKMIENVGPENMRFTEGEQPKPTDEQVLLRTRAVSVVMENVGLYNGQDPRVKSASNPLYGGFPMIQRGEVLAEAVEIGASVSGVSIGDRFASYSAYQEFHAVDPTTWIPISSEVSDAAAISSPFAGTTLHCVRRAEPAIGDDVLVIGQGPMGLMVTQWLKIAGAGRVIAADLNAKRLNIAQQMGATHTLDGSAGDLKQKLYEITDGNGPDIVIDSGNTAATFPLALELARDRAKVVVISWHTQPITIPDITRDFYHKELQIIATRAGGPGPEHRSAYMRWTSQDNQNLIARFMTEGRFDPAPLVTDKLPLAQFEEALTKVEEHQDKTLKVLVEWD